MRSGGLAEALLVGAAGATLAGAAGSLLGVGVPAAVVGAANGVVSGWRGIYDWRSVRGGGAFVLDTTWALGTTTAGLVAHAVAALRGGAGYAEALSRRQNRHVYARGLQPRPRFAMTLGNVVNGAGDVSRPRRVRLVTDHEDVHVWQARAFGPAYPVLYVGWLVGGALIGASLWATTRRAEPFGKVVETCAYYLNPFEWWAYSRDAQWPPSGKLDRIGWRRPIVRSFASFR